MICATREIKMDGCDYLVNFDYQPEESAFKERAERAEAELAALRAQASPDAVDKLRALLVEAKAYCLRTDDSQQSKDKCMLIRLGL